MAHLSSFLQSIILFSFSFFHYTKCPKALSYSLTQLFQKKKMVGWGGIFHCVPWRQPVTVSSRDVGAQRLQEKRKITLSLCLCTFLSCFRDPYPQPQRPTQHTLKTKKQFPINCQHMLFPFTLCFAGISQKEKVHASLLSEQLLFQDLNVAFK